MIKDSLVRTEGCQVHPHKYLLPWTAGEWRTGGKAGTISFCSPSINFYTLGQQASQAIQIWQNALIKASAPGLGMGRTGELERMLRCEPSVSAGNAGYRLPLPAGFPAVLPFGERSPEGQWQHRAEVQIARKLQCIADQFHRLHMQQVGMGAYWWWGGRGDLRERFSGCCSETGQLGVPSRGAVETGNWVRPGMGLNGGKWWNLL